MPDPGSAAKNLYLAAASLVRNEAFAPRSWHEFYTPLAQAVATQKSAEGQRLCREIARALSEGRADDGLASCRALVAIATRQPPMRWYGALAGD